MDAHIITQNKKNKNKNKNKNSAPKGQLGSHYCLHYTDSYAYLTIQSEKTWGIHADLHTAPLVGLTGSSANAGF